MNITSRKEPLEWKKLFESEEFETSFYYDGEDLGANYSPEGTLFKLWAPTADSVLLNLYSTGSIEEGGISIGKFPMERRNRGIWSLELKGNQAGRYYTYTIWANGEAKETQDVYSKAVGVNGKRSMVVDLSSTNPQDWQQDEHRILEYKSPIIYELHIKDFSSAENSGVSRENRGKYKAFTEKKTFLQEDENKLTCLAYIKALGVNYVHILPCFDFQSVDESMPLEEQFNWGYDPQNYNVPEGSYSSNPFNGEVRIREFKEMVKALHEEGIGVIMDVVYNHTYSTDSCFQHTVPYYYYRINEDGSFSDGSCCGNDTASERAMFRKYMIDSVCYWASEYHIDGFRFDLMGLHDVETINKIREALDKLPGGEKILMYGEPWQGAATAMKEGFLPAIKDNLQLLNERIAIFNDDTRDSIKGSVFIAKEPGFINGKKGMEDSIKASVHAWCYGASYKPHNPGQTISYVSSHDNYSLWDKLLLTLRESPDFNAFDSEVLQTNKLSASIIMTCLGIPFFQAGEEGARTKQGIGDSYKSPSSINQLNWSRIYEYKELVDFYRGLIRLRKAFKAFDYRDSSILEHISFQEAGREGLIQFNFKGIGAEEDAFEELFIIYNANEEEFSREPLEGTWKLICDGSRVYKKPLEIGGAYILKVPRKSAYILGVEKKKGN